MSSNALSLEGALLKYDRAKNSNETLAWSTAVSLCEGVMHALERTAVSGSDCRSMLRPNMSSCVPNLYPSSLEPELAVHTVVTVHAFHTLTHT